MDEVFFDAEDEEEEGLEGLLDFEELLERGLEALGDFAPFVGAMLLDW